MIMMMVFLSAIVTMSFMNSFSPIARLLFMQVCVFGSFSYFIVRRMEYVPIAHRRIATLIWCYMAFWSSVVAIAGILLMLSGAWMIRLLGGNPPSALPWIIFFLPLGTFAVNGCALMAISAGRVANEKRSKGDPRTGLWRILCLCGFACILLFVVILIKAPVLTDPGILAFFAVMLCLAVASFFVRDNLLYPERLKAMRSAQSNRGTIELNLTQLLAPLKLRDHIQLFLVLTTFFTLPIIVAQAVFGIAPRIFLSTVLIGLPAGIFMVHAGTYRQLLPQYRSMPIPFVRLYMAGITPIFSILLGVAVARCASARFSGQNILSIDAILLICGILLLFNAFSFLVRSKTALFFIYWPLFAFLPTIIGRESGFDPVFLAIALITGSTGMLIQYFVLQRSSNAYRQSKYFRQRI